jgi:hypothetical protein
MLKIVKNIIHQNPTYREAAKTMPLLRDLLASSNFSSSS